MVPGPHRVPGVETHDPEIFRRRCVSLAPSSVEGARPHPAPPLQYQDPIGFQDPIALVWDT